MNASKLKKLGSIPSINERKMITSELYQRINPAEYDRMKTIYVYCTKSSIAQNIFKIGETTIGGDQRIRQQDGTPCWEPLIKLDEWDAEGKKDTAFHKFIESKGLLEARMDKPREWYIVPGGLDEIKTLWNDFTKGISRVSNFTMLPEQLEAVEKLSAYFLKGGERALLDAIMRYGKTHVCYQIAKRIQAKNVLVLTYKPAVRKSWEDELNDHVAFAGMDFHAVENGFSGNGVYFSSMQGMLSNDKTESKRREWIYSQKWDLVIFDEEHYGSRSMNSMNIRERLEGVAKHWLFVSGTPYQARLGNEFADEQVFQWSYIDEQREKLGWSGPGPNPRVHLPKISFHTYNFSDKIKCSNKKLYSDEEQFRMGKLFAANDNNEFENPGSVDELIEMFAGTHSDSRKDQVSPWHSKKINSRELDHTFWLMPPSVNSCVAMEKHLKKNTFFKDFDIIIVAGGEDVTTLNNLNSRIKRSKKSITLSVGRFTTGVTVPEWGATFFLDDGRSPMGYFQAAFRAKSPRKEVDPNFGTTIGWKQECYVIDLNPHRTLEMVYTVAALSRDRGQENIADSISEFIACAPIYCYGEIKPVEINANDVLNVAITSKNFVDRFTSVSMIDVDAASDEIISCLLDVDPLKAAGLVKLITNANIVKGKIKEAKDKSKRAAVDKETKNTLDMLRKKAQAVMQRIPTYLYITDLEETSCQDIVKHGDNQFFLEEVGVSIKQFSLMLTSRFLDEEMLDNCIIGFNQLEKTIKKIV